ncbi:MATE family multidrug resistance protein [Kwoniella mangroviensis CBS 10435]|uniref:MATE family multidrug resistance protein n=1 Tax=Kwoniella mangroviensis CBS 10435 TaxID=1331196 RepID=A0A1B9IH25_9TREE|nr:MATE family multidrug resistance protein [Kwoniella mangroviensis CBS 10435]
MSNFPHSTSIAASLSTSPYAVQSNLENLINRARDHPHPRRGSTATHPDHPDYHDLSPGEETAPSLAPGKRRPSAAPSGHGPHIGTIQEASYEENAIIFHDDDDIEAENERSALLDKDWSSRRTSRASRRSYGSTSAPLGQQRMGRKQKSLDGLNGGMTMTPSGTTGNSRSRSKARTPPRKDGHLHRHQHQCDSSAAPSDEEEEGIEAERRGRGKTSRPLSRNSSPYVSEIGLPSGPAGRRMSVTVRMADDSSGDEGGDVTRGLVQSAGGAMFGGRAGLGLTPGTGAGAGPMDLDPVEELDAVDLELPVDEQGVEVRVWSEALRAELPIILRSSIPIFFSQISEWSLNLASVVSIGHLGTTELAASSLASMTAAVSSFSILQGLCTAMDTLLPAAWTSSDPSRVGLWTQRMAVVLAVSMIPMFMIWWNIEGVLVGLGQERDVAQHAAMYLRWLSLGIPGYGGNVLMKKYLQAQNLMHVPTYVLFFVAPTNLLMNYLFVWGPDFCRLGFVGGALATGMSYNLAFITSLLWIVFYGPREAFHPVKLKHCFSKLGTVTSLGLAGTIMLSSEWWAWEACALAASILGPVHLAAQSVLLSTASTFYQVPAALGIAAAVRVGNLLGAGRGWEAKWASRASLLWSLIFAIINSSICVIFRKNWGYLFNNDAEVVSLVAEIMPYIALFQLSDGIVSTAGAVLRSLGLHTTGALINLTSYYVIGLPFGLWLTFTPRFDLGLIGIWVGLSIALAYASLLEFWMVWKANWTRAVERIRERLGLPAHGQIGEDGKWDMREEDNGQAHGHGQYRDEEEEGVI